MVLVILRHFFPQKEIAISFKIPGLVVVVLPPVVQLIKLVTKNRQEGKRTTIQTGTASLF
jgi:hypothetical protein